MSKFCSLQFIPLQSLCYSVKKEVCGFAKPSTTICLDNTIESIQANVTGSTGKKNKTFKWSLHPWLLVLLPFPPSLEQVEKPLNNQAALEAAELLTQGELVTNICAGVAKLE